MQNENFLNNITKGKMIGKATWERLWTVERYNLRQIKMETGQQMRKDVRNLLKTAEDPKEREQNTIRY